jgi:hypothetical protein
VLSTRKLAVLLLLAVAVPATAQTFGFSLGLSARNVCLAIGPSTYRIAADGARADYTVRIDPGAGEPDVRVHITEHADDADFVLVDDGTEPPGCAGATKTVAMTTAREADFVVALAPQASAEYRIYVRSERLSPQAAAALFAVSRRAGAHALAGQ